MVLDQEVLIRKTVEWLKVSATKRKELHDKKIKLIGFKVGDLIFVRNHHLSSVKGEIKKFVLLYVGTFIIKSIRLNNAYILE